MTIISLIILIHRIEASSQVSITEDFCVDWKFHLDEIQNAKELDFDDSQWRVLDLPHDWSIEGEFSKHHPATVGGGAIVAFDKDGKQAGSVTSKKRLSKEAVIGIAQTLTVKNPDVWSVETPSLYKAVTAVECGGRLCEMLPRSTIRKDSNSL